MGVSLTNVTEAGQVVDASRACKVDDCGKAVQATGLCGMHYRRLRVNGTLDAVRPYRQGPKPECKVDDCTRDEYSLGYCRLHYERMKRTGETGSADFRYLDWSPIIDRAAEIVNSYSIQVTLRQLFYRLVMEEAIPNKAGSYSQLSRLTAARRREGEFPALLEHGRRLREFASWDGPADRLRHAIDSYQVDRTEGQDRLVFIAVEKNALSGLLVNWFSDLGVPVLPLGGYGSETLERATRQRVESDGRGAVLIYAGDFDAAGLDIERCFIENTADCWDETVRVGLSEEQIMSMGLPVLEGKKTDSKAKGFIADYPEIHARAGFGPGVPVQVELDAIEPLTLRSLYQDALSRFWDDDAYQAALSREETGRERLEELVDLLEDDDE